MMQPEFMGQQPSTSETTPEKLWLKPVILLSTGVYFGYNLWSGNLNNYINERFMWLSYVATALLFLMGIAALWSSLNVQRKSAEGLGWGEQPRRITWAMLGVAAIPFLFGTMVPSRPLGIDAINGGVSTRAVMGSTQASSFTVPPERRNILDWLRAFGVAEDYETFNGQPVDLIGFVYREPQFEPNQFMISRFTLSCCVADSSALGLPVIYKQTAELPEGTWVNIQGRMRIGTFNGDILPMVEAETLTMIDAPQQPYLYP